MDTIVKRVTVERDEAGSMMVEWVLAGGAREIDIAAGQTPDTTDHVHVRSVTADASSVRLDGLGDHPNYVSIRVRDNGETVVAAPRRVEFEGVQNFRDLGGYRTADGGHTVWGQVYRADSLHKLTAADLVAIERLGIRTVYDLRSDLERETHPNPLTSIQLAVIGQAPNSERRVIDPSVFSVATDGQRLLRDMYIGMLEHSALLLGQLLNGLARDDHRPAVFHCHAGKDRTGIVAALVLLVAGVAHDDILDDYELTSRYRTVEHQQDSLANLLATGMSPEAAAGVLTPPRWAMADALDEVDNRYGGIDAYLTGPAAMTPAAVDALRRALVTHAR